MAAESTIKAESMSVIDSSMCVEFKSKLGIDMRPSASANTNGTNETELKQFIPTNSLRLPDDSSSLEIDASLSSIPPADSGQAASGADSKTGTGKSNEVGDNNGSISLHEEDSIDDQLKQDTASGRAHGGGDAGANKNQPDPEKSKSSYKYDPSDPGKPAAVHMEYTDGGATYRMTVPAAYAASGHVQMGSNNNMTIFNGTRMSGSTSTRSSGSGRGGSGCGGRGGPTPKPAAQTTSRSRMIVVPNREVTSLDLQTVAREITRCWKPVARYLGVSESQIETVRIDNGMESVEEVAYQMLRGWHLRTGTTATVQKLAIALQNAGQLSIVEKHLTTSANP